MKRRTLVGGLLSLSVSGCLRLTNAGGPSTETAASTSPETTAGNGTATAEGTTASSETATETTRPSGVSASLSEPPEAFVVGRPQLIGVRVTNNRDDGFEADVRLMVDGVTRATESISLRSRTATTVEFDLTLDSLQSRAVEVVVTGDGYESVLVDEQLQPAQHAVTLDWGETYVPAEDPNSNNEDDRRLSFFCRELVLERDGDPIASYDVGVFEDEPRRLEGKYDPEDNDGEKWRWFGGPEQRTIVGFEDGFLANADALRFVGHLPPKPDEMPVTASVGDRQTDQRTWTEFTDEYVVSLALDG